MANINTEHPDVLTDEQRQYDLKALRMLFTLLKTVPPELVVVLDIETTGLLIGEDEILQISLINGKGETLLDEYVKPRRAQSWPEAEKIHGISPEMVSVFPTLDAFIPRINEILQKAQVLVGYNSEQFDLPFMAAEGISVPNHTNICDVMQQFAIYYGEWLTAKKAYRWKSLDFCASAFQHQPATGSFSHNSLYDALTTLYCYNALMEAVLTDSSAKVVT